MFYNLNIYTGRKRKIILSFNDSAVNTWSGLHRDTVSQEKWTDGTTPIFANYGQETPTSNGGTFCFTLRASDGFWIEKDCNQRYMFVCKMNIGNQLIYFKHRYISLLSPFWSKS